MAELSFPEWRAFQPLAKALFRPDYSKIKMKKPILKYRFFIWRVSYFMI